MEGRDPDPRCRLVPVCVDSHWTHFRLTLDSHWTSSAPLIPPGSVIAMASEEVGAQSGDVKKTGQKKKRGLEVGHRKEKKEKKNRRTAAGKHSLVQYNIDQS